MTIINFGSYTKLKSLTVKVNPIGFTVVDVTGEAELAVYKATHGSENTPPHWIFDGAHCVVLSDDEFAKIVERNRFTSKTVYTAQAARAMSRSFLFIQVGEFYIYANKKKFSEEVQRVYSQSEPCTGTRSWNYDANAVERAEHATETVTQRYIATANHNLMNQYVDFVTVGVTNESHLKP